MMLTAWVLGWVVLSLIIWLILLLFWGQFWRSDQCLSTATVSLSAYPMIAIAIPARNEANLLPDTLPSLLTQDYPGQFQIILVDDDSTDNTSKVARSIAQNLDKIDKLCIIPGKPLPPGWTGKLWAMHQGTEYAQTLNPEYILLTDADIYHEPHNLAKLVAKAQNEQLDLVSLMVKLRCKSFWEKLLIPAFIFFFEKLYPFRWVNNHQKSVAAAAGGCILISSKALHEIGGIAAVKNALIDDCALATAVKLDKSGKPQRRIWLGLGDKTQSLRPYDSLSAIWDMVTRTAYTQLNYSPLLLISTVISMSLIYLLPPLALIWGLVSSNWLIAGLAGLVFLMMSIAYLPTIRLYKLSPLWAFSLSAIAFLYTLMTLDSARRHWLKQGGSWKGRVYSQH